MLNIVICEDDKKQQNLLKEKLEILDFLQEHAIYSFSEEEEMIHFCSSLQGDLIFFMDIVLKDNADGIAIAKRINRLFPHSVIIFVSAYLEKVTEIFETCHCYFIYKPELDLRLERAVKKAVAIINEKKKIITIQSGNDDLVIAAHDILWIERIKRYSLIQCNEDTYRVSSDFEELLSLLPDFFRQCHRCYIVNFAQVKKHTRTDFVMKNGKLISISRGRSKEMNEAFQHYVSTML